MIAEAVLDLPAEQVLAASRIDLAESALHAPAAEFGGVEFYTDPAAKTAVLAWRLIRNHPLPDGDVTVAIIEGVAAGEVSETELAEWVDERLTEER